MQPKDCREAAEQGVNKIGDEASIRRLPVLDQLSEPGVVDVAAEIAGSMWRCEAGNQNRAEIVSRRIQQFATNLPAAGKTRIFAGTSIDDSRGS